MDIMIVNFNSAVNQVIQNDGLANCKVIDEVLLQCLSPHSLWRCIAFKSVYRWVPQDTDILLGSFSFPSWSSTHLHSVCRAPKRKWVAIWGFSKRYPSTNHVLFCSINKFRSLVGFDLIIGFIVDWLIWLIGS